MLLENTRRIKRACDEINVHKKMPYYTSNIETYLEGIVGIVETDLKNILLSEFFSGNILIKENDSKNHDDAQEMIINSVYSNRVEKLDEL